MSVKRFLYIDDNKIDSQIDNLRKKLKRSGIELVDTFVNFGDERFKIRDPNQNIILNIPYIKDYFKENILNENFDIVASDYDYSDHNLDGYHLLKWIMNVSRSEKAPIRKAKFCLYSAQQDKLVNELNTPDKIKELIKLKIDDFISRDRLSDDLATIISREDESYNFNEQLVKYLEKFPDYRFRDVYPKFKNKPLSEIAHEINKDLPNGIEFQKTLVELTIAHLIELNKF